MVVNYTSVADMAWLSNYISLFVMDAITYLCPNPDDDLANNLRW